MQFNKAFFLRKEDRDPQWRVVDAEGQVLGRLATQLADALRGKDKPHYTPHTDGGDYIVVLNAAKVKLTGNKKKDKIYARHTGWMGGYKELSAEQVLERKPEQIIMLAVKRMLPKNKLSQQIIKKLKVYPGAEHPHQGQVSS